MTNHRKSRIGQLHAIGMPAEQFVEFASPIAWHHSSKHLHRAANVVAAQVSIDWQRLIKAYDASDSQSASDGSYLDIFCQFFLLAAFALENVLKGIVVGIEPGLVQEGKLQGILTSHDLVALSRRANISLTPEETRLCDLAFSASVSWGRYPVSTKAQNHVTSTSMGGSAIEVFNSLYDRLSSGFFDHINAAKNGA